MSPVDSRTAINDYVTKEEGGVSGPYFVGKNEKYNPEMALMDLRKWQQDLFSILTGQLRPILQDRKVILVQDDLGGAGKSKFVKWLRTGQKKLVARKLPVSSVDRLTSGIFLASRSIDVDLYTIDLPRTISEKISLTDLFHTIEEVKNGYVVDTMYGKYTLIVVFTNMKCEYLRLEYLLIPNYFDYFYVNDF